MPIYEFRCPDGHTFETFQRMSDAPPEGCEICGKGPLEKLLYPVAVHFKGSGFYSTDYGRSGRKAAGKDGDSASSSDGSGSPPGEKAAPASETKSAAADSGSP